MKEGAPTDELKTAIDRMECDVTRSGGTAQDTLGALSNQSTEKYFTLDGEVETVGELDDQIRLELLQKSDFRATARQWELIFKKFILKIWF